MQSALLLLNEVLMKGFDAGHFVTGFAQHLRDVLVSKDAATVQLLETSETIRVHYQEQAKRCNAKWLFNALDVMNTCDINYRTAKNKRLTVELALVKLCRLVEVQEVQGSSAQKSNATVAPKPAPTPQSAAPKPAPQAAPKPVQQAPLPSMPTMGAMPSLGNIGLINATPTSAAAMCVFISLPYI